MGNAMENQLELLQRKKNRTERAICGLAVVISVAAAKVDNHSFVADLLRCMFSLDDLGKKQKSGSISSVFSSNDYVLT